MPNQLKFGSVLIAVVLIIFLIANKQNPHTLQPNTPLEYLHSFPIHVKKPKGYNKGMRFSKHIWNDIYIENNSEQVKIPPLDAKVVAGLKNHLKLLKRRKLKRAYQVGNLSITKEDLKEVIDILLNERQSVDGFAEGVDLFQINGKDGKGNVYFTGYYTPIIKVNSQLSPDYPYPLYGKPNRKDWLDGLPSRSQIDGEGALIGKGLELAFARSLADIYYMQLQGSGIIEYPDGKQEYLSFTGTNGHSYRSIERHVVKNATYKVKDITEEGMKRFFREYPDLEESILFTNPSYVFFDRKRKLPHGAGHVPLTGDVSIAVDDKYIPLGSVLLAAIPVLDNKRRFSHHEYKILLAQDLGGAIRGSGRVDLYFGKGTKGRKKAMSMHHYGQLWLLLPKGKVETKGRLSLL